MESILQEQWKTSDLGGAVRSVAWSPDGKKIAVGTRWYSSGYHCRLAVFSSTGEKLWETEDLGGYVFSVAWSPDRSKLAVGVENKTIVFILSHIKTVTVTSTYTSVSSVTVTSTSVSTVTSSTVSTVTESVPVTSTVTSVRSGAPVTVTVTETGTVSSSGGFSRDRMYLVGGGFLLGLVLALLLSGLSRGGGVKPGSPGGSPGSGPAPPPAVDAGGSGGGGSGGSGRGGSGGGTSGFPGELLGLFRPLEFLGRGGFGSVWRVERLRDGVVSALKVPDLSSGILRRVFLREVGVWMGLRHPNIVELRDANVVPRPYLEMEYVPGAFFKGVHARSLGDLPKPLPVGTAVRLFRGLASGVGYAHGRGVVHRDLKPLNVLLTGDLSPKITDWGLAKVKTASSGRSLVSGYSPGYAAPEQLDEDLYGGTDERTDIYQLGVILYEMLTRRLPYDADTPGAMTGKIVAPDIKPSPPSTVDPGLAPFDAPLMKALAKRKEDRYNSVSEFLRDVEKAYRSIAGEASISGS